MKGIADLDRNTAEAWEENSDLGKWGEGCSTAPVSRTRGATGYGCKFLVIGRAVSHLLAGGAPSRHLGGLCRGKAHRPCG